MKILTGLILIFIGFLVAERDPLTPLLETLEMQRQSIGNFGQSFETQLFNQDVLSTPRLRQSLNNHLIAFDGFAAMIYAEQQARGESAQLQTPPPLSGRVAVRTPFYQSRISEHIAGQLSNEPFPLSVASVTPNSNASQAGYPTSSAPSNENHLCTSGGFFTRSEVPQNITRTVNLFTDFSRDYDRECPTPDSIRLSLNGRALELSCGGAPSADRNTQNAVDEMTMCDPLLYGFHPRALNGSNFGLAACHYPPTDFTGRGRTYSSNITGRSSEGDLLRSHCDLIAEGVISPGLQGLIPDSNVSDRSLVMAAQLALENPTAWTNKTARARQHCGAITRSNLEYDHCQNLLHRIQTIEGVMQRMRSGELFPQQPNSNDIPEESVD